jgi:hypothetical protein
MQGFLARLAILVLTAALAHAGDCLSGSSCSNECPLAKQANVRLADGRESFTTSKLVRADYVRRVLVNLEVL